MSNPFGETIGVKHETTTTICVVGGTSALNFVCMDAYKKISAVVMVVVGQDYDEDNNINSQTLHRLGQSLVSGGLAGATAIAVLFPLVVVRTNLALDMGTGHGHKRQYPAGMRDAVVQSWRVNGWRRGLYSGLRGRTGQCDTVSDPFRLFQEILVIHSILCFVKRYRLASSISMAEVPWVGRGESPSIYRLKKGLLDCLSSAVHSLTLTFSLTNPSCMLCPTTVLQESCRI